MSTMPDLATITLFLTASVVLLAIPGPTVALVVARSLSDGRRITLPLVLGVGFGDLVAASVSLAGAGALLAASASAFTIVKAIGALYLIWLGVRLFLAEPVVSEAAGHASGVGAAVAFRNGFLVTVFNPKGILFFVAFVPQFIDAVGSYVGQAAFFVLMFTSLAVVANTIYALGADALRRQVIGNLRALRVMNRVGGTTIALAGVAALLTRRPAP